MTKRPPAVFAWRKPFAPTAVYVLFYAIPTIPFSFVVIFGLLPPFWGGPSRGLLTETHFAWDNTAAVAWNYAFDILSQHLPFPEYRRADVWVGLLENDTVWSNFLVRLGATFAAAAWVIIVLSARRCFYTGRTMGFEYASGPRLLEGRAAIRAANAAIAEEDSPRSNGLYLTRDLKLSLKRELGSFGIFGTQGSGKTTVLKFLFAQLIDRANTKLIILDQKGDFTAQWPSQSVIFFAPHDQRSHAWDIGADVVTDMHAHELAASLIPIPAGSSDPFWPEGARQIAEALIIAQQRRYGKHWGFLELLYAFESSPTELRAMVEPIHRDVLEFLAVDEHGQFTRTAAGFVTHLRAKVMPMLRPLAISWGLVPKEKRVSLRSWLYGNGPDAQTLILQNNTNFPEISATWMRSVIRTLVRITGSSSFPDFEEKGQNIWFILDEFPQIGHLPELLTIPETHRSKGVTLLLTAQAASQIYTAYDKHQADTLFTLLQTKIILQPGQGSGFVEKINDWLGQFQWRDPADSGTTDGGSRKSIAIHHDDPVSASYMATLGKNKGRIEGLVVGLGSNPCRVSWPLQKWSIQRPGVLLMDWANRENS